MIIPFIAEVVKTIDFESVRLSARTKGADVFEISNLGTFKAFIEKIEKLEIFDSEIRGIKKSALYNTDRDAYEVDAKTHSAVMEKSHHIIEATRILSRLTLKMGAEVHDGSVYVKLPAGRDLAELILYMQDLQKAFSQAVVNETIRGEVKVGRWDSGSFWLEILLGSQAAVGLLAGLVWSAAVIRKKLMEGEILVEYARGLKVKEESLNDLLNAQKEVTRALIENEAKALLVKHFDGDDYEQLERLKMSLKLIAELICKGAEVHPALSAPEEVKNLFPDFKALDAVASQIKQVTATATDNSSEA